MTWVVGVVAAIATTTAGAQERGAAPTPITRVAAVAAALANGPRISVARTDTSAASAAMSAARAFPNPALAASYTKATPQYHLALDQPIEYPWLRSARSAAASEFRQAAFYRFAFERAAAELEADTIYTTALAAAAHARLSQRAARDADSLRALARLRRDAGDASELELELAAVNAGQAANASAGDSLAALAVLLELQRVMGLSADRPLLVPVDSLLEPAPAGVPARADSAGGSPLAVAAAEAAERGAQRGLSAETRNVFTTPSVQIGVDTHDPSGAEPGLLPMVGITLPLPLWNQHGGEIAAARAGLARAQAELATARRESEARIARARRQLDAAIARVDRDKRLLASAERVAAMSLRAYAEGAAGLPTVLEAHRAARDALVRYVDDLAAAQNAAALLRLHTMTATTP